jgi:hypothetical protein
MTGILNALIAGVSGAVKDAYFNLVSLLLPGNGTNGAQNNTFLDSSTNNFTITRNGDVTQGTFSPFSQTGWGNYFDGSGDSLSVASNAALQLTGEFTIEAWYFPLGFPGAGAFDCLITTGDNAVSSNAIAIYISSTGGINLYNHVTNSSIFDTASGVTLNTWNHIAATRNASNGVNLWINGVSQGSTVTVSSSFTSTTATRIGSSSNSQDCYGYISNARIVKGTAVYTGAFTPPTAPLTAITNTSLLTCQSNRFIDNSSSPKTITPAGNVAVTPFSPFAPTQSYSAAAVGGSGYFDGSGDYLDLPSNANLATSSSDFTLECWVYLNSTAGSYIFSGTGATIQITGGSIITYDGSNHTIGTPIANQWCHIAICRSGSTIKAYYNGTESTSWTNSGTQYTHSGARIGAAISTGSSPINGYITNYRLIVGTALYTTSTITVPTAPLTAVSGTSLLLNFTNAGVVDATAKNVLETVGNAQISTTQSKWGGGSISFDGTSNTGLKAPAGNLFTFGSGAFTVEFWVRFNSVAADQAVLNVTGTTNVLTFYVLSTGSLNYYLSSNGSTYDIASGVSVGSISTGQWYRVALVRSGNTFTPYLNTTAGTTSTSSSALATPSSGTFLHLGMSTAGTSNFNGYIDDVRVTRGVARDMTVLPTAPFPVQ